VNAAELEFALARVDAPFQPHELAEDSRGEILDTADIEQNLFRSTFHERIKFIADFLDLIFGDDFVVDETDDGDAAYVFKAEVSTRAREHKTSPAWWRG
jgi:hypothetical protein